MAVTEKEKAIPGPSTVEGSVSSSLRTPSKPIQSHSKIDVDPAPVVKDVAKELKPVSILSLFRFSTNLEIFLDIIGLICASCAGAAQVCNQTDTCMKRPSHTVSPSSYYTRVACVLPVLFG